jgi:hypothetical protein
VEGTHPGVRADASPLRCPFCHDGVDVEQDSWRACEKCLARHHGTCWDEAGRCSACGSTGALTRAPSPAIVVATNRSFAGRLVELATPLGFTGQDWTSSVPLTRGPVLDALAIALSGRPLLVVRQRALAHPGSSARHGTYGGPHASVTIEAQQITVRAAAGAWTSCTSVFSGLFNGVGGAFGMLVVRNVAGGPAMAVWMGVWLVLAIVLARLIARTTYAAAEQRADKLLDALEEALRPAPAKEGA